MIDQAVIATDCFDWKYALSREIHLEPGSPFYAGTRHTPGLGDIKLCSPAPFSLANYLIINNGRFQVIFTKPQKKNTPDLN